MHALLGTNGKKGRRRLASDNSILERMAKEYIGRFYGFKDPHPSLSVLADWALEQVPNYPKYSEDEKVNRKRVVARKFRADRDRLLAEVAANHDFDVRHALSKVNAAKAAIRELGIALRGLDGSKSTELNL